MATNSAAAPEVQRAVILAAGLGRRLRPLTEATPKPLLPIAGTPVLDNSLSALAAAGVSQVTIVVGHLFEAIEDRFDRSHLGMKLDYIHAEDYASTNNIVSVWLARDALSEDCLLLEGDVFFEDGVIERLLSFREENVVAIDRMEPHMTGSVAALDAEGYVSALQILPKPSARADAPDEPLWKPLSLYLFRKEFSERHFLPEVETTVRRGLREEFYEQSLMRVLERRPKSLRAARCDGCAWAEIDDLSDYARAQLVFFERRVARPAPRSFAENAGLAAPRILRERIRDNATPAAPPAERPAPQRQLGVESRAEAPAHHGEVLQGVFLDADGRKRRGLVSLIFPQLRSVAWARRTSGADVEISPEKSKAAAAVRLLLERFGARGAFGISLRVKSRIPEGFGLGSSTADVVAALRSVSALLGRGLAPEDELSLAVRAEGASDGAMFHGGACLIAHREGRVIERFGRPLPSMGLISVNAAPERPVDTLALAPARYDAAEIASFGRLRAALRRAIEKSDLAALAGVATMSAEINEKRLAQPRFADIKLLARSAGALGLQVAHSGRMIGLVLPPGLAPGDARVRALLGGLRELGLAPEFHPALSPRLAAGSFQGSAA